MLSLGHWEVQQSDMMEGQNTIRVKWDLSKHEACIELHWKQTGCSWKFTDYADCTIYAELTNLHSLINKLALFN